MSTTERKAYLDGLAVCSMLLCCVIWGIGQVAAKVAVSEVPPLLHGGLRSLGAALLVAAWARLRGIPLFDHDRTLRGGLLAGALFAGEFGCIFFGLQYTTASRMAVFIYLAPFVVALGMPLIARSERLNAVQFAGLTAASGGVAWAFAEGFGAAAAGAPLQWLGDALGVLAAVLWGATTLVVRASRLTTATPEKTLLYQLAVSGVLMLLVSPLVGETRPQAVSTPVLIALVFQIVAVSFATFLLWFWLIRHYPATPLAVFTLLTPVAGLAAGVLILSEPVTPRLLIAMVAVAGGIWLVSQRRFGAVARPRRT